MEHGREGRVMGGGHESTSSTLPHVISSRLIFLSSFSPSLVITEASSRLLPPEWLGSTMSCPGGVGENLLIFLMGLRKSEVKVCNGTQPASHADAAGNLCVACSGYTETRSRRGLCGGYWALAFGEGERTQLKWSCGERDWFTVKAVD